MDNRKDSAASEAGGAGTRSEVSGTAGNLVQARDVSGGVHFHSGTHAREPRPAQLPADVPRFVNRTRELQGLDALLATASPTPEDPVAVPVAVIVGTAGVGKTSLALRWAHRIKERFPDGQLYANLHGYDPSPPVPAAEILGRFLRALDIPVERIPAGEEPRAELYRSSIAQRRLLVVLDNAATVGQIRPLLPGASHSVVIVTSRARLAGLVARDGAHRVSVETLSQAESVNLLRKVLTGYRTGDRDEDLDELARLCARLPLALRIAAEHAAARPHMPLRDLIADLRDSSGLWDALSAGDVHDADEADAVRTVFAWSYRALTPPVARMFRLLGLHPGPDFSLGAAAALAALSPVQARRQLDTLASAHLLEEIGHERYQFHDLLRAYANDQLQQEESATARHEALTRVLAWYLHTASAASEVGVGAYNLPITLSPSPVGVTPLSLDDAKAAIAWYETERDNLTAAVRAAAAAGMHSIAWQIPAVLTTIIVDREPAGTWLAAQEIALESALQTADRYGEAVTLENLGIAHRHLFDLTEAEHYFVAAKASYQQLGDTFGEARVANGLGVAQLFSHHLDSASESFRHALDLAHQLSNHSFIAAFTRNLGWAYLEHDDTDHAEPLLKQAADMFRRLDEPLERAEALTLLAATQRQSNQLDAATRTAEDALALAGESAGTLFEALALLELGRIALDRHDPTRALECSQQAAALFQRAGRSDLQAAAWDVTGQAYLKLGRATESAHFHHRAATAHRNHSDRWLLALSLAHLADALTRDDNPAEARKLRRQAASLLSNFHDGPATTLRSELETLSEQS